MSTSVSADHPEHHDEGRKTYRRGVMLIVAAMMLLPGIDAIAKFTADQLSPGQLSWGRFTFQALYLLAFVAMGDGFALKGTTWKHVGRGVLMSAGTVFFFAALVHMPMADTMAIYFVEPLILTLLAPVFLAERIGWRRVVAVIAGLGGALLVIQPSFRAFGVVAFFPIGAAIAMALYIILTRTLTRQMGTVAIQFYAGVFGMLFMTVVLTVGTLSGFEALTFTWPTLEGWGWLMALAAIATIGHLMIVQAVRHLGASLIAPFQYLEIVSATTLGFLIFGDFPGPMVWGGIVIIVLSGLYVFHREQVRTRH